MNVMSLIRQHPLLFADIKNLGISHNTLHKAASTISVQLAGSAEYNLCNILAELSARDFTRLIDPQVIAEEIDLHPALTQSLILTIAPWVDKYRLSSH